MITGLGPGICDPQVRMHIALTRATVRCDVVAPPEALRADPRLAEALRRQEARAASGEKSSES